MTLVYFGKTAATQTNREFTNLGETSAVLDNGNIVHIWRNSPDSVDPANENIWARIVAPDGTPVGDEFIVNTWQGDTDGDSFGGATKDFSSASVSAGKNGGFNVYWQSARQNSDPGEADYSGSLFVWSTNVMAQQFDNTGAKVGVEKVVEGYAANNFQTEGTLTHSTELANGNTIITWLEQNGPIPPGGGGQNDLRIKSIVLDEDNNVVPGLGENALWRAHTSDPSQSDGGWDFLYPRFPLPTLLTKSKRRF